jgi:hypothetical protein
MTNMKATTYKKVKTNIIFIQREACLSLGFAFLLQQQMLNKERISYINAIRIIKATKTAAAMT